MLRSCLFIIALILPALSLPSRAEQAPPAAEQGEVTLVLSGGGRHAWSHIGVIQWMEENHIPIHHAVGTSGGGLVAGMYAMGYTPDEMVSIIENVPWETALRTELPYDQLPFRRKQDRLTYPSMLEFGFHRSATLRYGLAPAHAIGLTMARTAFPYSTIRDFDNLWRPFRCVSVDLVNALEIDHNSGSIYQALRGTMAVPLVFTPLRVDAESAREMLTGDALASNAPVAGSMLNGDETQKLPAAAALRKKLNEMRPEEAALYLTDGGVMNILPVNVAQRFHPSYIVASTMTRGDVGSSAPQSLPRLVSKTVSTIIAQDARNAIALLDRPDHATLVEPDTSSVKSRSFADADLYREAGYQTMRRMDAMGALAELRKYRIEDEAVWAEWLASRQRWRARNRHTRPDRVDVRIIGVHRHQAEDDRRAILKRLQRYARKDLMPVLPPAAQNPVLAQFESDLTEIASSGRYESVSYEMRLVGQEKVLIVLANQQVHGPPLLNTGMEISTAEWNDVNMNIRGRLTAFDVSRFESEIRLDFSLGTRTVGRMEYYHPLRPRGLFLAPRFYGEHALQDVWQDSQRVGQWRVKESGVGLDAGFISSRRSEFRVGYDIGHRSTGIRSGPPDLAHYSGPMRFASLRWIYDGQDSAQLPTRGLRVLTSLRYYDREPGGSRNLAVGETITSLFVPTGRGSLFVAASGGTTFGHDMKSRAVQFTLGGPLRLSARGRSGVYGSGYGLVSAGYMHQVASLPPVVGDNIRVGLWYEYGAISVNGTSTSMNNVSAGLIAETLLGPILFSVGVGDGGDWRRYISIGRLF